MTRTSKIYFKELNPQTKNDLKELKRIKSKLEADPDNRGVFYIKEMED